MALEIVTLSPHHRLRVFPSCYFDLHHFQGRPSPALAAPLLSQQCHGTLTALLGVWTLSHSLEMTKTPARVLRTLQTRMSVRPTKDDGE